MYEQLLAGQLMRLVAMSQCCMNVRKPRGNTCGYFNVSDKDVFVHSTKVGKNYPEHPCSSGGITRNALAGFQQGKRRFCCFYPW